MIYFYGDSHARVSFANLNIPHKNYSQNSITMFRIARDNLIIRFNPEEHDTNSIICLVYGEIDCRCQIKKQVNLGRNEDDIIYELVENYFKTIQNNVLVYKKIIIVGVIPPTKQKEYESAHGHITHMYPFVGTDEDRVQITLKVNNLIKKYCEKYGYIYFNPYSDYTREDGTLKFELSDTGCHIKENSIILQKFTDLYNIID